MYGVHIVANGTCCRGSASENTTLDSEQHWRTKQRMRLLLRVGADNPNNQRVGRQQWIKPLSQPTGGWDVAPVKSGTPTHARIGGPEPRFWLSKTARASGLVYISRTTYVRGARGLGELQVHSATNASDHAEHTADAHFDRPEGTERQDTDWTRRPKRKAKRPRSRRAGWVAVQLDD